LSAAANLLRRVGGLLDRRRVTAYCAMLLAGEIVMAVFYVTGTYGLIVPLDRPATTDFVSFYAAGRLADAGTPELAYDRAAHLAGEERATAPGIKYNFFYYPPVYLLLCAALAVLPYLVAFFVFELATLALYLVVLSRILGEWRWTTLFPFLVFPVVFWNFGYGQNGFLTAALFGAAMLAIERRPIMAGLLFGAICYKPHFGLLIPIALAAGGYWRAVIAAAVSVAGLVVLSLAIFGEASWHQFAAAITASHEVYESGVKLPAFVTPFGAARVLGGAPVLAYAVQALATLVAAVLVALVWRRRLSLPVRAAMLAAATLVAVPVALFYDLMLATLAAAWLYRSEGGLRPVERALFGVLFVACLDPVRIAETTGLPLGPIATLSLVGIVAHRAWREMASRRGSPGIAGAERRFEPVRPAW
jgi:glycosyl transferase family 87